MCSEDSGGSVADLMGSFLLVGLTATDQFSYFGGGSVTDFMGSFLLVGSIATDQFSYFTVAGVRRDCEMASLFTFKSFSRVFSFISLTSWG